MISVVIPLYNKEKSILNTVNSVLNQSYRDFELIVVDDGSKDNSLKAISSIIDKRLRIIKKENGGVSSARNEGIKAAKYSYIAFLDGDDIWLPWHLQVISRMIAVNTDPCVGGYSTKFIKLKSLDGDWMPDVKITDKDFVIDNYLEKASASSGFISSSNFAVKKQCFDQVGLYNENLSYGEDVELWYRLFKTHKLVINDTLSAVYFTGADNRSDKRIIPLEKRFHLFDLSNKPASEKKYLLKLVSLVILDYSMMGAYKIAFNVFLMYKNHWFSILNYYNKLILKKVFIKTLGR